jgi:ApaG protein
LLFSRAIRILGWEVKEPAMPSPDKLSHQIRVSVSTDFLPEQSAPEAGRYAFAYTITIHNAGAEPARLLNRHWLISDAEGKVQEVRGKGVVGEQPYLRPGETFRYTSGTILPTPLGTMQGSYEMIADDGTRFEAPISAFSLATPTSLH